MSKKLKYIEPYIFTEANFLGDETPQDHIILGIEPSYVPAKLRFNVDDMVSWNEGSNDTTTVHLVNASFNLTVPIDEFDELIMQIFKKVN